MIKKEFANNVLKFHKTNKDYLTMTDRDVINSIDNQVIYNFFHGKNNTAITFDYKNYSGTTTQYTIIATQNNSGLECFERKEGGKITECKDVDIVLDRFNQVLRQHESFINGYVCYKVNSLLPK